jgi:ATP-dependent DNA helicase RecG
VLPGAGPRTAERLAARGLATVGDLLFHLPRAYEDLRRVTPIAALGAVPAGTVVLVRGTVERVRIFPRRILDVTLRQDGAAVRARWFRPPRGMEKGFVKGAALALAGPVRINDENPDVRDIVQPAVHKGDAGELDAGLGIRARYPAVAGVGGRVLEKIIGAAIDRHADAAVDALGPELRARLRLPGLAHALRAIHARGTGASVTDADLAALAAGRSPAHRRLAFEDLLILQLGFATGRRRARARPARPSAADPERTRAAVQAALPFTLTGAQVQAIDDIARDMAAPRPMQRLLVGDVGSGKTAVAFAAAAFAAASGGQTLLMAPTEVLVDQHLQTLSPMASALGLRAARLTAATPRAERAATLADCRGGRIQLLIGTQALLEAPPLFPDLRLAIVDEQHRFGVAQRARLRGGENGPGESAGHCLPHLLVMSATPIPRTLALTLYGDLDVSVIGELPPGRQPPVTTIVRGDEARLAAYQRLLEQLAEGRQAFVVCPVREQAQRDGAVTAVGRHRELRRTLTPGGVRVGLLHGDLDPARKEAVLRSFAAGAIDLLVATTVVELGIDVPNATVMLIEEADRFGLAQLHQLRGRVGRGAHPGRCFLCTAADPAADGEALRRLEQLAATADGFRIAEADMAMRGHGDLAGLRQAGAPRLRFADLADYLGLIEIARAEAERIGGEDPELAREEHRALREAVSSRWSRGIAFSD